MKKIKTPYNNSYGLWKITTEDDCEGRTVRAIVIEKGYIDELAKKYSGESYYSLTFHKATKKEPVKEIKPTQKGVHITLDIDSDTWEMTKKERVAAIKELLKDTKVEVSESNYYASVYLTFLADKREKEDRKKFDELKKKYGWK